MAEDPIRLFAKRSERYPEPTEADAIQGGARAALAAIPVIGGAVTEVLSLVLAPAVSRRRDEWFKDLADGLDLLEEKVEGFRVESLIGNEVFVSAVIQATRAAASTHQSEKREALRNAVLNCAQSKDSDEEKQLVFVGLIDTFTVTHLELLKLFKDPAAYPADRRQELRYRRALTDPMVIDLDSRGLLVDPRPYVARNRESPESLTIQGWTLTPLGKEFLAFISRPAGAK